MAGMCRTSRSVDGADPESRLIATLQRRPLVVGGAVLLVLLLAWGSVLFRYQYRTGQSGGYTVVIRLDRWTGAVQECIPPLPCPWEKSASATQDNSRTEQSLPADQAAKVTGNAGLSGYGSFSGKIYNGSDWILTRMIVRVVASRTLTHPPTNHFPPDEVPPAPATSDSDPWSSLRPVVPDKQILWNRKFRVDVGDVAPLTTDSFSVSVTGDERGLHSSWTIEDIFGRPPVSR